MKHRSELTMSPKGPSVGLMHPQLRPLLAVGAIALLFAFLFLISVAPSGEPGKSRSSFMTVDELYNPFDIKDVHLEFTDSAWKQLQPFGGPYGINGVGVGVFDFSPIPRAEFMHDGDVNRDDQLSHKEFIDLAERWFNEWDSKGHGELNEEMIGLSWGKKGMDFRGEKGRRNGIGSVLGIQTRPVVADMTFAGKFYQSISVRMKGSGSLLESNGVLKKPFKVDMNEGFPNRKMAGVLELNFQNLYADPSYINDLISYRLYRDAKVPTPRTGYARMFVTNSDTLTRHYLGLYLLLENVDNAFAQNWYGTKKGVFFKPSTPRLFEFLGDEWNDEYFQTYDPQSELSIQEKTHIIEVCRFVSKASEDEFARGIGRYFDLDELARYMAVSVFISDLDGVLGPGQNLYMYLHPKSLQLSFIPWDHDRSFGQYRGTQKELENLSIDHPWLGDKVFLNRLFGNQQFNSLYKRYMAEFHATIFSPDRFISQVNEIVGVIRPAIQQESDDKLKKFDKKVGLAPTAASDSTELKPLIHFVHPRYKSVGEQLSGTSKGMVIQEDYRFYGGAFMAQMDKDKSKSISHEEFIGTFEKWFVQFADAKTGMISRDEMKTFVNKGLFAPPPEEAKSGTDQSGKGN